MHVLVLILFITDYCLHNISDVLPDDQVGPLIVPAFYVPSTSVVLPKMLESLTDEQIPKGLRGANEGEMAEKEVYDFLKDYYSQKEGAALIINNNTLAHPEATKKEIAQDEGKQEADFIIVDKDIQTLINIEVKTFLGKYPEKPKKDWPKEKVKKQMSKVREIVGDAFQSDIKGPWKIVSIVFYLESESDLKICSSCNDYITKGKNELLEALEKLHAKRKAEVANLTTYIKDFVAICKFLLFCCPVISLPVLGNLSKVIKDSIVKKSGTRENIGIYCFPTPQQRGVLCHPWLIFAAPFGSGKTLFMIVKAIELADAGEKVLFLVFVDGRIHGSDKKTLLCLDLEEKFKNHPLIKVKMVPFVDGKMDNLKGTYLELIILIL